MRPNQPPKTKKSGRRLQKQKGQQLVLVGAKVTPEVAAILEQIAQERRWSISGTVRYACELLVDTETAKAA